MGSSLLRRYLATCAALWMLHGISEHSRCSAQSFSALYESDWTNLNASYASFCNMSLNNSFGWDGVAPRLQEPQRTIILESGAWDSARLSTHIVEILIREVLGYKVMVKEYVGGVTTGNRVKYQIVDAAVELWTSDASYYNQMVLYEHSILDAGKSGYTGQIGCISPSISKMQADMGEGAGVPSVPKIDTGLTTAIVHLLLAAILRVVQAYSNYYMDFWRSLRIPAALSIYPRSGMGVHMTINNPPQPTCTGITGGCQNGTYVPSQCINNTHCVEFLSYGYTPFYSERLIDGLKLNITVNYMVRDNSSLESLAIGCMCSG
ncbi:uncharacterized protein BJ171DRAFT_472667 [Polychytrium aggregatum]|uniref:uncharacterized protein n=1 Tax=Polychytrium aggregatum TaxID=110093 RepID=UPI0022FE870C|nr:uncharacterized protein BJ171DRAFT_472667 [Polychytrium aggregatum]KAI9207260.1 hypothetical protein BJ171DRAFT_472667 [Polychytrium aggregatum]